MRWCRKIDWKSELAFTLIELVASLGIIGILSALAYPNYRLLQQNSYNTVAQSDARHLVYAAELLAAGPGLGGPIVLSGAGGRIPELYGAVVHEGTMGTIDVRPEFYFVETFHQRGSLCYRYQSEAAGVAVIDLVACSG